MRHGLAWLSVLGVVLGCAGAAPEPSPPPLPAKLEKVPLSDADRPVPGDEVIGEATEATSIDIGTLGTETPTASERRTALRLLATCFDDTPACHEEVCAANFGPGGVVVVSTPAPGTISGMSEEGPVPLGPVPSVEIDASGAVRSYDLGEGAIPCEAAPEGHAP